NDYTQDVWEGMVYDELAAGRPMIYNGTAGSGGGHSFICEGYEYGNYYHINWGWSGMGNGYFQLAVLNPHESGIGGSSSAEGYNMKQNIVYNVIPGGTAPADDPAEPELTCTAVSGPSGWDRDGLSNPFKIHKSKIVKVSFSDHSGTDKKFKAALALQNPADGTFEVLANSEDYSYFTVTTSALGETRQFGSGIASTASNVIKFGAGLTGTYRLVGVYQVEGTSEWKVMKEADRHYLEVNMSNTYCTGTQHPIINLQATNWEFTGGERVGLSEQVHVTLKNNSVDRFYGDLYLDFGGQQIDEYSQYTTVVTGEVKPGEENTITFNVTPASAGNKTVRVMLLDQYGQFNTIAQTTVNIAQSAEAEELNLSVVIAAENAVPAETEGDFDVIYDTHARFSAAITNHSNGEYNKYVLAPLFLVEKNADGTVAGGSMVTYKQLTISLAAGETKTFYFDFDNLAPGSTYAMNIYARNNVPTEQEGSHVDNIVKPGESVYYDVLPGIITWTANGTRTGVKPVEGFQVAGDVVAVSLEGLTLNSIVANQNPNTLYFIDENATAPAGIENCNIVNGSMAQNIAIKDGYPFMTPQSFVAQAISYERTFTKARREGIAENWSTIVLPFTPTTVSNNNLWIERFAQEVDGVVTFSEVNNMEANVPYIIAAKQDAIGTPITWSASNVLMKPEPIAYTSGDTYLMTGTFVGETVEEAYAVNAAGSVAKWGNAAVEPFRAYFTELEALENHTDIELPGEATTPSYLRGDVNGDGEVDVRDITALIDVIMNSITDNPRADVNEDGDIDVRDITALIDIIMNN
ncbi:MAG: C10 family peptidase, partial [Muribaculaceae bacterium]|nr:C10 family peptidase [Muribaculaceae bacterium]